MTDDDKEEELKLVEPEHLEHLALFPLPGAVFFPGTMLPLHIFEPRYRQMTAEALEDGMPIAVMHIKEPHQLDEQGRPSFHEIGGAGFVMHHQLLPDGRYNILLEGTTRVRVVEELDTDKLYRVGRAEIIMDAEPDPTELRALLMTLRGCVVGLRGPFERLAEALAKTMNNIPDPGHLADTIAGIIVSEARDRQRLLEELSVERRLDEVIGRLTDLLATVGGLDPDDGGGMMN